MWKMTRLAFRALAVLFAAAVLLSSACSEKPSDTAECGSFLKGKIVQSDGCKSFETVGTRGETPPSQDCIEYEYDGQSVLRFTHVNTGFNCCPDSFSVDYRVVNRDITIFEDEYLTSPCRCWCLFDLEYEMVRIPPGKYIITVTEPYLSEGDPVLEFEVDLIASPSGSFCLDREHYPWHDEQ